MPCVARKEDGTFDRAMCESLSLHPIKNHQICNQKGVNCDSPYRICRICAGQRFRVLGCYRKDWKDVQPVDLEGIRAISAISGLCYDHHIQAQNKESFTDRFPHKVAPKPVPVTPTAVARKRRGRKPRIAELPEEEVIRDVCDELGGELPEVNFDPDEDLGLEPGYEVPAPVKNDLPIHSPVRKALERKNVSAVPKAVFSGEGNWDKPLPQSPWRPPITKPTASRLVDVSVPSPARVLMELPAPKTSLQRNPKLEELDSLRAFLAQPSSGGGAIVEGDDE